MGTRTRLSVGGREAIGANKERKSKWPVQEKLKNTTCLKPIGTEWEKTIVNCIIRARIYKELLAHLGGSVS